MIDINVTFVHYICTFIDHRNVVVEIDSTTEDDLASIPVHFTPLQSNVVIPKPKA